MSSGTPRAPGRVARFRGIVRAPAGRVTNQTLLVALVLVFGTGVATVAVGSASGRWVAIAHGIAGQPGLWVHIAVALVLVPLVLWHVVGRRIRPRWSDLSGGPSCGPGCWGRGRPGSTSPPRERSGCRASRGRPALHRLLRDRVVRPGCDADHELAAGPRPEHRSGSVAADRRRARMRATLDCTSGWYAQQDWTGVPVRSLLRGTGQARSLLVHSATGYWIRLPVSDVGRLLLATQVAGAPLSAGHGYPLRLVAPGRRGYWWVKWVDRIELQTTPWWWQPPFPVT